MVVQRLNADHSDHSLDDSVRLRTAGALRGPAPETFTTVLGLLTLERAYYHCDACRRGGCPRDQALGLQAAFLSAATTHSGIDRGRGQLRQGARVVGGPGRGRC